REDLKCKLGVAWHAGDGWYGCGTLFELLEAGRTAEVEGQPHALGAREAAGGGCGHAREVRRERDKPHRHEHWGVDEPEGVVAHAELASCTHTREKTWKLGYDHRARGTRRTGERRGSGYPCQRAGRIGGSRCRTK